MDVFPYKNFPWSPWVAIILSNYFFPGTIVAASQNYYILVYPAVVVNCYEFRVLKVDSGIYLYIRPQIFEFFSVISIPYLETEGAWPMNDHQRDGPGENRSYKAQYSLHID